MSGPKLQWTGERGEYRHVSCGFRLSVDKNGPEWSWYVVPPHKLESAARGVAKDRFKAQVDAESALSSLLAPFTRLAASLSVQPCPKCAELRAENERLRKHLSVLGENFEDMKKLASREMVNELNALNITIVENALSPTEQETQETQENEPK